MSNSSLLRNATRSKVFGRIIVLTLSLATFVAFSAFAAAPDRIWSNGIVLDVDTTRRILAREEDSTAPTMRRGLLYAVQADKYIYLTEEIANGQRAVRLKGNSEIMFAVEGDSLFILGEDRKERETHVIKKISRTGEQQAAPPPVPQPPSRVLPVDNTVALPKAQLEPRTMPPLQQTPPSTSLSNILPEATPVRMRISRTVSSADAQVGENVDFETLDDVKAGSNLVIPSGSVAIGTITDAVSKKRMARGGRLTMNIDYVRLPSGGKLPLRGVQDVKGGGHTGAMTGGMVATAIVFWPAAPFFLFMHGKDVTIPKGHEVTVYTNTDYQLPNVSAPIPTAAATPPPVAPAPKTLSGAALTNADVLKLKTAGLSDQFIIDKIKASPANYHLDVDDLVQLKKAGIAEAIIAAMMQTSQR